MYNVKIIFEELTLYNVTFSVALNMKLIIGKTIYILKTCILIMVFQIRDLVIEGFR